MSQFLFHRNSCWSRYILLHIFILHHLGYGIHFSPPAPVGLVLMGMSIEELCTCLHQSESILPRHHTLLSVATLLCFSFSLFFSQFSHCYNRLLSFVFKEFCLYFPTVQCPVCLRVCASICVLGALPSHYCYFLLSLWICHHYILLSYLSLGVLRFPGSYNLLPPPLE